MWGIFPLYTSTNVRRGKNWRYKALVWIAWGLRSVIIRFALQVLLFALAIKCPMTTKHFLACLIAGVSSTTGAEGVVTGKDEMGIILVLMKTI